MLDNVLDYGACPRCNCYNTVMTYNLNNQKYQVRCLNCKFRSMSSKSKYKAKKYWKQKIFAYKDD